MGPAPGSLAGWLRGKPSVRLSYMRLEATNGTPYVERRDEAYWVEGTRVSLDSVVYAFWNGQTPESIAQSFPTLMLEQVYGAIAFYLAHRDEIDRYLAGRRSNFEAAREKSRKEDPAFYAKLAAAKRPS
ncbi:MAG TPA: DUF433 domain-containing protein [Polyangiaceae bacterium]